MSNPPIVGDSPSVTEIPRTSDAGEFSPSNISVVTVVVESLVSFLTKSTSKLSTPAGIVTGVAWMSILGCYTLYLRNSHYKACKKAVEAKLEQEKQEKQEKQDGILVQANPTIDRVLKTPLMEGEQKSITESISNYETITNNLVLLSKQSIMPNKWYLVISAVFLIPAFILSSGSIYASFATLFLGFSAHSIFQGAIKFGKEYKNAYQMKQILQQDNILKLISRDDYQELSKQQDEQAAIRQQSSTLLKAIANVRRLITQAHPTDINKMIVDIDAFSEKINNLIPPSFNTHLEFLAMSNAARKTMKKNTLEKEHVMAQQDLITLEWTKNHYIGVLENNQKKLKELERYVAALPPAAAVEQQPLVKAEQENPLPEAGPVAAVHNLPKPPAPILILFQDSLASVTTEMTALQLRIDALTKEHEEKKQQIQDEFDKKTRELLAEEYEETTPQRQLQKAVLEQQLKIVSSTLNEVTNHG